MVQDGHQQLVKFLEVLLLLNLRSLLTVLQLQQQYYHQRFLALFLHGLCDYPFVIYKRCA